MPEAIESQIVWENMFWLQIMGDHARFLYNALSLTEKKDIEQALSFIRLFDGLLSRARVRGLTQEQITSINQESIQAVQNFRIYQLQILSRQLTGEITYYLQPELTNHFVLETDEYLNLLNYYKQNKTVLIHPVHLHLMWIRNLMEHSIIIEDQVSFSYRELREQAGYWQHTLSALLMRATEMSEFMKTGLQEFPAMTQLTTDAVKTIKPFDDFFVNLEGQMNKKNVLGNMDMLMLNHMHRELCYYVTKLAQVTDIRIELCNPNEQRKESVQ